MGTSKDIPRAEFPPARYWRRWGMDAAPPSLPALEVNPDNDPVAPATAAGPAAAAAESGQPPYRVLVVEDDRSQGLFAESVLAGAGIQARAISDPAQVMHTLESMRPDLVLMDLHMPAIDGAELTDMIRAHATLAHTPIVFLTGDTDPERQFEALEIGADDFLTKPVRPRHLIAAVENRIMRARQQQAQRAAANGNLDTGLLTRSRMFQRLAAAIPNDFGSLYLVQIEGMAALRERLGYSALEELLDAAARRIAGLAGEHAAARINDNTFLVHAAQALDIDEFARQLRDGMARQEDADGQAPRLRASVGCAPITRAFANAGDALTAAEQALRSARTQAHGIAVHAPSDTPDQQTTGLAGQVASAVAERRIELAFQPIVAVAGGDEAQYQVLMRLRDADGDLLTAAQVLPIAEAAGLVHEIDRQVLEQAIAVLQRQQHSSAGVRLFVSQSAGSLGRIGYAEWLLEALTTAGVDTGSLVIDVQQDDALIQAVALQEFSAKMVPAGVQLCLGRYQPGGDIDALLPQLPLSFVRLAPGFSSRLGEPEVRDRMREAVERAHRLGLLVIGQQVEDPQAAATLWMSGIDFIQGNLVQQAAGDLDFDFHHSVL
ncbi:EAL domain-containing protein [Luteimonas qiangzhengi]|uniref:EAL domain-containing protein n=1 Tax=Luteimonas sp. MJ146 TaxID=3129240 RepID=UPI0031BBADCF